MRLPPTKSILYVFEGVHAFACAYFFNYLMQRLKRDFGWSDFGLLGLGAAHGLVFIPAALFGGRLAQRHGYFRTLRLGCAGCVLAVAVGGLVPTSAGQVVSLLLWTAAICATWPVLEALAPEGEPGALVPNRIGRYNVVWAGTGALGVFLGGTIYRHLGTNSLYWLPALVHVGQLLVIGRWGRLHADWLATARGDGHFAPTERIRPPWFRTLGLLGNPFCYMAQNTLLAVVPGIGLKVGLDVQQTGWLMSVWFVVRAVAFGGLWRWTGWHYRFGWFAAAFGLLIVSFVALLVSRSVPVLVLAQVGFGAASALIYYSSLYYSLDGSEAAGEHSGIHEAFVGLGICGGPAVGTLALWITRNPAAPAWAVTACLMAGLAGAVHIHRRGLAANRRS